MANFIFNKAKQGFADGTIDWDTSVIRILAVSTTSIGTPVTTNDFLAEILGPTITEITETGYSRQTLTNNTVSKNDGAGRSELDTDNVNFGNVSAGDTVVGFVVYLQVGGDDLTPADDVLIAWFDTDADGAINKVLGGGPLEINVNVAGLIQFN